MSGMRSGLAVMTAAGALAGAAAPPAERVVTGDAIVPVTINGVAIRLRVQPAVPGMPLVTRTEAERLGLKGGGMLGFGVAYHVGREVIFARTAVAKIGWGGARPDKRRVGWTSRDWPTGADGTVGPEGLPDPVVRFQLRPPRPGERTVALPLASGGLFGGFFAANVVLQVGATKVAVRFDPDSPRTVADAPAGAALAEASGGRFTDERGTQTIVFGIERPVRVMTLARPSAVGPFALTRVAVRVTDGAGANTIAEPDADPAEVVVHGRGKRQAGVLRIGADQLDRCSSITFDKPAKEIRLSCG